MRTFYLWRETDDSGVSGTGKVAEGVEFTGGLILRQPSGGEDSRRVDFFVKEDYQ